MPIPRRWPRTVLLALELTHKESTAADCRLHGPVVRGCFSRCNHYTPCLVRPKDIAQVDRAVFKAVEANGSFGFGQALLAGSAAHRRLYSRYQQGRLALRITGPLQDGFWVRATVVLAHAHMAQLVGLPLSVAYRSIFDSYDNRLQAQDGWGQYFEPINADWPKEDLVQFDCALAASAWHRSGTYAYRHSTSMTQRAWRTRMVQTLPINPRPYFWRAADDFWLAHGVDKEAKVLGVHMRGTDKKCHAQPKAYLKFARAFACHTPSAIIFIATDDRAMIEEVRATWRLNATCGRQQPRLLWRDVLRGFGRFNAGVYADNRRLNLTSASDATKLGAEVLIDTLLLARSSFLVGSNSAVVNYAMYFNPQLQNNSYLLDVSGQPRPPWLRYGS